jgi:hypothetical protein
MKADMEQIGALLGKALARPDVPPHVNVHVPEVKVTVDAAPLADAIQSGHDLNTKALESVGGMFAETMCKAVDVAIREMAPTDFSGLELKLSEMADAITGADGKMIAAAIGKLSQEISRNTDSAARLLAEMKEQTRIMLRPKVIDYDDQGRITLVRVV